MAQTGNDIIYQALRNAGVLGIGTDPVAEDLSDTQSDLNDMLAQWQIKRWMIYHLVDLSVTSDGNTNGYTIGPAGAINVAVRPDKIESAYVRQLNSSLAVDVPLMVITDRESYSRIPLKTLVSFPKWVYYDADFPLGKLIVYPWPNANLYQVHVIAKMVLSQIVNFADPIVLPLEYFSAMKYNLAVRARARYGKQELPGLNKRAEDAINIITQATGNQVPALTLPGIVTGRSRYNIYSDQSYS